jgi:hypothetical protein
VAGKAHKAASEAQLKILSTLLGALTPLTPERWWGRQGSKATGVRPLFLLLVTVLGKTPRDIK